MADKTKTSPAPKAEEAPTDGRKKRQPPAITRKQFREKAPKAISIKVGDVPMIAGLKEFQTGSLGYNLNGRTVIDVDGVPCEAQIGVNITLIGSNLLPKE